MAGQHQTSQGSGRHQDGGPLSGGQSPRRRIALVVMAMWIVAAVNGVKLAGGFEARTPLAVMAFVVLCAVPLGLAGVMVWWDRRG